MRRLVPSRFLLRPALGACALAVAGACATATPSRAPTVAPERRSTQDDLRAVAVTIYNENLALVKEVRRLPLDRGVSRLALRDVSARMRPETALLRSLSSPDALRVREQNFDFDLLTPQALLAKSVGGSVRVVRVLPGTGAEVVETAQVLAAQQGVVLKIGDRIETGVPGRIVFDGVPPGLRDRPTLVTELDSAQAGPQDVELSYLTGGLSWQADYVAELDADDATLDLAGWITLHNQSGTAYPAARVQLVAGDLHQVSDALQHVQAMKLGAVERGLPAAAPLRQEALFEYHLYTLERPTTLADQQRKQVALLSARGVPARKELLLEGSPHVYHGQVGLIGTRLPVAVRMAFDNREAARLGQPLPRGVVRVFKRDSAGHAQFVGEDRIDHTPRDERVSLKLGQAFDITADKRQTDWRRRDNHTWESAYEIVLRNAKDRPETVTVREPVPGDWTMLQQSQPHEKVSAGAAQWRVTVPPRGSATLTYRVLSRG